MPQQLSWSTVSDIEAEALYVAPFFYGLDVEDIGHLIEHADLCAFERGERLLEEGAPADTLYLLFEGEVELAFEGEGEDVPLRTIGDPGYPIGWSVMVPPYRYRATATAATPVRAVALSRSLLEAQAERHPAFSYALMRRILWALGRRLREARIRLVVRRFDREALAIRALLEQSAGELPVTSPLHKIPYYLENRLTLSDAFDVLGLVRAEGSEREQYVAGLCLEVLKRVRRELALFQHLQRIYELVASAPPEARPEDVNRACMDETLRLFEHVPHVLRGEEHLPERPGHIVVMNHLYNHVDYLLPNHFHFTLDTHFVSAVLYRRYGAPPVRVVREAEPGEFGHQRYYDHLGHLYVYRGRDDAERRSRRRAFFEAAGDRLRAGQNVVVCPAGDSTSTECSPLPFKTGAFQLASLTRPEPFLVPVAVAYFDKKITRQRPVAVIHPPLRLSDEVGDEPSKEDLVAFAADLRQRFQQWVREAAGFSEETAEPSRDVP